MSLIPLVCLTVASLAPGHQESSPSEPLTERLVKKLDREAPALLARYQEPGMAIALVENGRVTRCLGYGLADKENETPVTKDTIFQVGSISKTLTAWAVLHLVEQGELTLDAAIPPRLERWQLPDSDHDAQGVTVRRLLSHTAGISQPSISGVDFGQELPALEEELEQDVRLIHPPGEKYVYSGGGYTILQLLVEETTGRSFADYLRETVFAPLGMSHTFFGWNETVAENVATPYDDGERRRARPHRLFTGLAGAGLYTTAQDLGAFLAAHCHNGDQIPGRGIVSPDLLASAWKPAENAPEYGLGYELVPPLNGSAVIMHGGSNLGWKAHFLAIPELGVGIAVMTNTDGGLARRDVLGLWRNELMQVLRDSK